MSVFFLAYRLLLRLLRWDVLVSGSYVVFYACFLLLKYFHWGPACGLLLLLFSWKMQKPNLAAGLGKAFSDFYFDDDDAAYMGLVSRRH